jgi:hypothetical protein
MESGATKGAAVLATLAALADLAPRLRAPHLARAAASHRVLLAGVRASVWPEVAWSFSRVQPGGCPLEITFSTASEAVWAVAEIAGPEMPESQRLARAALLLEGLGQPLPPARLAELGLLQGHSPSALRWGAWLGARHAPTGDRYKLYAEVPDGETGESFLRRHAAHPGDDLRLGRRAHLNSVGADATGRIEIYYGVHGMAAGDLARLLACAGQHERAREVLDLLDQLANGRAEVALASSTWGFSLSASPGGELDAFTFYKPATHFLGGDRRVRDRLLTLAGPARLRTYRQITRNLTGRPGDAPLCNLLLAVIAVAGRPLELRIGVDPSRLALESPPWQVGLAPPRHPDSSSLRPSAPASPA